MALLTAGSMRAVMPEPGPTGARGGDHVVVVVRGVAANGDLPGRTGVAGGHQGVDDQAGGALGGVHPSPRRSRVAAITGAETGVETTASNAFRPLTLEYPYPAPCLA